MTADISALPDDAPRRATAGFMVGHPARWIALGFGSGLSPKAPGTVGTLWAWAAFLVLDGWLDATQWAGVIGLSIAVGWWACTRCAQHLHVADPGAIVWDEVVAFWIVLWLLMPAPGWAQLAAFALFRYFDITKPQPARYFDEHVKNGFGVMADDLVAAGYTLLALALLKVVLA